MNNSTELIKSICELNEDKVYAMVDQQIAGRQDPIEITLADEGHVYNVPH